MHLTLYLVFLLGDTSVDKEGFLQLLDDDERVALSANLPREGLPPEEHFAEFVPTHTERRCDTSAVIDTSYIGGSDGLALEELGSEEVPAIAHCNRLYICAVIARDPTDILQIIYEHAASSVQTPPAA